MSMPALQWNSISSIFWHGAYIGYLFHSIGLEQYLKHYPYSKNFGFTLLNSSDAYPSKWHSYNKNLRKLSLHPYQYKIHFCIERWWLCFWRVALIFFDPTIGRYRQVQFKLCLRLTNKWIFLLSLTILVFFSAFYGNGLRCFFLLHFLVT